MRRETSDKPAGGPHHGDEAAVVPADRRIKHLWPRDQLYDDEGVLVRLASQVERILGPAGYLLSASKSDYRERHPDHEVLFNACLFTDDGVEIWFGDIDITNDHDRLQQVADLLGERLVLTPEKPYRFQGLPEPEERDPDLRTYEPRRP
jgi:hypothetical protein